MTPKPLRTRYPERFDYADMRPTKAQQREAAADMRRDMHGEE